MKKTRFLACILTLAMVVSLGPTFAAGSGLSVTLDGTLLADGARVYLSESGRTMVAASALEGVFTLEYKTSDEVLSQVTLRRTQNERSDVLTFYVDGDRVEVDGYSVFQSQNEGGTSGSDGAVALPSDTTVSVRDGTVYLPIRYTMEWFGFAVGWDGATNTVSLTSPVTAEPANAETTFDFDLLSYMPQDQNYMVSPLSLKMALAMAANGAEGATQQELLDVLGIDDLDAYNSEAKALIASLNSNEEVEFNLANSIWYNTDFYGLSGSGFAAPFVSTIQDSYQGVAQTIDNATGSQTVNDWISAQTKDKITDVVSDEDMPETLSLLVNTIYFKGKWSEPFNEANTQDAVFTDRNGKETETAFMNYISYYACYEDEDYQVLACPYEDGSTSMYFVLPKDGSALTQAAFENAVANMEYSYVSLSVPKFTTEYTHKDLVELLKALGVQTAFDAGTADFFNMFLTEAVNQSEPPYISNILQKTFISVDENGTEAAAATVVGLGGSSTPPPEPIVFRCDRPFTYIIRDDNTGTILFLGEYAFVE
ncbi:MAG: hypothetical protein LUG13_10080 [Oscillospiraceae bacterium]|nr:hypothetical protein [Oscillospiraceae bacterium]